MTKKETVVEPADTALPGNLDFWNDVEETNPEFTKPVGFGAHTFTAIDAYYQIKNATEKWGQYGKNWGLFNTKYVLIPDTPLMQLFAEFAYPITQGDKQLSVRFPISTAIKIANNKGVYDADFAKKIETSLICKSLSRLGFNADVFLGKFDDNIYVEQLIKKQIINGIEFVEDHTEEQEEEFKLLLSEEDALGYHVFLNNLPAGAYVSLLKTFTKGNVTSMKAKATRLEGKGKDLFEQYLDQMVERIASGDDYGLIELGEEVGNKAKEMLFNRLSSEHQQMAREMFAVVDNT